MRHHRDPAPADDAATESDTTSTSDAGPEPTAACHTCGIAVPASTQRTWTLPTSVGDVHAVHCSTCHQPGNGPAGRLYAALAAQHPEWLSEVPFQQLDSLPQHLRDLPAYVGHPADANELDPGHGTAWAHIPDRQLVIAVDHLCRHQWPAEPPPQPPEQALTAQAVRDWPGELACWRCGVAVAPDQGRVVTARSISELWRRKSQLAESARSSTPEAQHDARLRREAPDAPAAAYRECGPCTTDSPVNRAQQLAFLAAQHGQNVPDLTEPAVRTAATSMWFPAYAASAECDGPTDPGRTVGWMWAPAVVFTAVLTARADASAPQQPAPHPSGLPCQVCGTPRSLSWESLVGLPCCRGCVREFAPRPDTSSPDTRGHDRRPARHPRGEWWLTWELGPPPAADVGDYAAHARWQRENLLCDADLICAAAAGQPGLVRAHLAARAGFYLAHQHPNYRRRPSWSGPWDYLTDLPETSQGASLVEAVAGVLHPPKPPAPAPAAQAPAAQAPAAPTLARPQ